MTNINGTAVVTGASAGIGKVSDADRLAQRGYYLLLVARRSELLTEYLGILEIKI